MALLSALLWWLFNGPQTEPIWPTRVQGFSFSPMHKGHDPRHNRFPKAEEIDADLGLLQGQAHAVRTYTVENVLAEVPQLARRHGLNVALGGWVDKRLERNETELQKLVELANANRRNVVRVVVGNEVLLHHLLTYDQLVEYLRRVRKAVSQPVSVAEPWHIWIKYPKLVDEVDYIAVHMLPYWEGVPVESAVDHVYLRYQELKAKYPGKPIVIAEVGWPSNGRPFKQAEANLNNQAMFLRRFLARAEAEGWTYYIMEAFDQPWKKEVEGAVGAYWGVYDLNREPKFPFTQPLVRVPDWPELLAISVLLSMFLLAPLCREGHLLKKRGRGFLAVIAWGAVTAAVYFTYQYTRQYMTWGTVVVGVFMALALIVLILILLVEAHEWAEALWLRESRRSWRPTRVADHDLPFVSIHVPCYNEPPDMVRKTLDALARLDYPLYEVLVIDNNTKDPAVWEPVRDYCSWLGKTFRFFHVAPLAGFKAGALNYALRQTAPEARVIAVIDSDYIVERNWLRDLVPAFVADPKVAIVQAPQDYRDGKQNAFKAMCMAEYRGFFDIGMVTRNERNAIIQHGTMTMVRRESLQQVEGWAEWCITEDAELGLRLFEEGHHAVYVPRTYGRGLMPDSFLDFKKQRFRWAYGAVMILRHHAGKLFGRRQSDLTGGQRYHFVAGWLPWIADGFNLVFNIGALAWTLGMVVAPSYFDPPLMIFAYFPIATFVFKSLKLMFLYRVRVVSSLRQSLAAALAGLALSHTIALAMLTGFVTSKVGFFRTPKQANAPALLRAFADAREELLMLVALNLGAFGILAVQGREQIDVLVWAVLLWVQSIPYAAAVLVSLISAMPRLPAELVGTLKGVGERSAPQQSKQQR